MLVQGVVGVSQVRVVAVASHDRLELQFVLDGGHLHLHGVVRVREREFVVVVVVLLLRVQEHQLGGLDGGEGRRGEGQQAEVRHGDRLPGDLLGSTIELHAFLLLRRVVRFLEGVRGLRLDHGGPRRRGRREVLVLDTQRRAVQQIFRAVRVVTAQHGVAAPGVRLHYVQLRQFGDFLQEPTFWVTRTFRFTGLNVRAVATAVDVVFGGRTENVSLFTRRHFVGTQIGACLLTASICRVADPLACPRGFCLQRKRPLSLEYQL